LTRFSRQAAKDTKSSRTGNRPERHLTAKYAKQAKKAGCPDTNAGARAFEPETGEETASLDASTGQTGRKLNEPKCHNSKTPSRF
jgi:hypothetical protein